MTSLHLHTEISDARVTLTVIGELDAHAAPSFAAFVAAVPARPDVIDARYLNFVDAAGLRALLAARAGSDCALVPSAVVGRLVAVAGLDVALYEEPFGPPRLDDADFAVAVHDADLRIHYVNRRLAEIDGLPATRHTGKLLHEVFDVAAADITDVYPVRWMLRDRVVRQIVAVIEPASSTAAARSIRSEAPSGPGT